MHLTGGVEPAGAAELEHAALFYRDQRAYVDALVPFITEGLDHGHPVAAAVPGDNLRLLREALGPAARRVELIDMGEAGRNPGRILPAVLHAFADQHPDAHVRIIGEPIWAGRRADEYPACVQHEALINSSFAGRDITILCPYDASRLDARALRDAEDTHPVLSDLGQTRPSLNYAPDAALARYNQPLSAPPDAVTLEVTSAADLPVVRRLSAETARRYGMSSDNVQDLRYIVTELVTNSLSHTRDGWCQLRIWRDRDDVVCSVSDTGKLTDPLVGRRTPPSGQLGGWGLLMVNYLADLVRMYRSPVGTTVQARLELTRRAPAGARAD